MIRRIVRLAASLAADAAADRPLLTTMAISAAMVIAYVALVNAVTTGPRFHFLP